jgi:Lar family restriction alleviation protein
MSRRLDLEIMDGLRSCPFCGDDNAIIMRDARHLEPYFLATCSDCGARTEGFQTAKEATEAWNHRPLAKVKEGK